MKLIIRRKKRTAYTLSFYFLWAVYVCSYFFLQESEFAYMNASAAYGAFNYVSLFVAAALMFMFCLSRQLKLEQLLLYVVLFAGMFVSMLATHDKYLMVAILIAVIARKIDIDDFVKFNFIVMLFVFISITSSSLMGVIPNYSAWINGAYKQAFGFGHPNTLATVFFIILLHYVFLFVYARSGKLVLLHFLVVGIGFMWMYNISAARSGAYTFVVIYFLVIISKIFPNLFKNKVVGIILALLPALLTACSFYLVKLYDSSEPLGIAINSVITGRLMVASQTIDKYGVSLFGQILNTYNTRTLEYDSDAIFSVDMSYIKLPIRYGLFVTLIILAGYYLYIRRIHKDGNIKLLLAVTYFVAMGFGESYFILMPFNFTLLFILKGLGNEKATVKSVTSSGYSMLQKKKKVFRFKI